VDPPDLLDPSPKPADEDDSLRDRGEYEQKARTVDGDDCGKTVEHRPIVTRNARDPRQAPMQRDRKTRECPNCGWEEDADAKFCSVCQTSFNKTELLNIPDIQAHRTPENPLANVVDPAGSEPGSADLKTIINRLPDKVKYGGLACVIIMLLLIIFGR
jgi:hypothetical protein